jgi:hypothetical protein
MIRVYIAGPIGKPKGRHQRVITAINYAEQLVALDPRVAPFIPHLMFYWDVTHPGTHDYEWWMRFDGTWIDACQAILRIPGESPGADREVAYAKRYNIIPVFECEESESVGAEDQLIDSGIVDWLKAQSVGNPLYP